MDVLKLVETAEKLQAPLPPEIAEYRDESDPEVAGGWTITGLGHADWALQRLGECEAEGRAAEAQYQRSVERLARRRDLLQARAARGVAFFTYKLLEYANRARKEILGSGKKKSRDFLHGTIAWRKHGGRLKVKDKDALQAWIETLSEGDPRVRVKKEPAMKEIQERYAADEAKAADAAKRGGPDDLDVVVVIPPGMEWDPVRDEPDVSAINVEEGENP